jgi:hypothetical protein
MFTSFKHLPIHRHKSELNPIKGMVVYSLNTYNHFKILRVWLNNRLEPTKIEFQSAKSTDAVIHEIEIDKFWENFTTNENNLRINY